MVFQEMENNYSYTTEIIKNTHKHKSSSEAIWQSVNISDVDSNIKLNDNKNSPIGKR